MVDILLVSEIAWCVILMGQWNLERTLLNFGGLVSSGYVATISSTWSTRVLLGHSAPTMIWLTNQIQIPAEPVGLVGSIFPAQAALGSKLFNTHWLALHIASALLVFLMTLSVFTLFIVVSHLLFALWDSPQISSTGFRRITSSTLGLLAGLYLAFLTGSTLANLSWLRLFTPLSSEVAHSYLLGIVATLTSIAQLYVS